MTLHPSSRIVIIGAGCFGTSTAYHLLLRGYTNIIILERSEELPAVDGASNDINRIVRASYADPFYTNFAQESIKCWENGREWGNTYHKSGVLMLGLSKSDYVKNAYLNDIASRANVTKFPNTAALRSLFPFVSTNFQNECGYLNSDGGWADAFQGTSMMIEKISALGCKIYTGKTVVKFLKAEGDAHTRIVECGDETRYVASLVVVATGAWTPSAFPDLALKNFCGLATGQCSACVQLTEEEAAAFRSCPLVLDLHTGFYIFPPNKDNVVKMAMHGRGYTNGIISTPRTIVSDPVRGLEIPMEASQAMREHLGSIYPTLVGKPFIRTRLCWYNETPDENWIIGPVPDDPLLIMATGDSGHAYKFLPLIGKLVADVIEKKLDPKLAALFAVGREFQSSKIHSRGGQLLEHPGRLDQLCSPKCESASS